MAAAAVAAVAVAVAVAVVAVAECHLRHLSSIVSRERNLLATFFCRSFPVLSFYFEYLIMETQTNDMREAWLRLMSAEIAPQKLKPLIDSYAYDAENLLSDSETEWLARAPSLSSRQIAKINEVRKSDQSQRLTSLDHLGISILRAVDPTYPQNLKSLPDAPAALYVRGTLVQDDRFSIAIVGSRRATSYGLAIAEQFSVELVNRGLTVVSGGARGIDTRAHKGALAGGRTVAFVGCGLDVSYPAENKSLFAEMISSGRGAIVSEFVPGTTPEPWRFPARNRLISGMSLGVIVIESPLDSGAMITATDASQQGREVFAVPGPIGSGRSAGCHKLIQEGAKLIESPEDIFLELGLLSMHSEEPTATFRPTPADLSRQQTTILDLLSLEATHVDQLILGSRLPANIVNGTLTLLEMRGLIKRVAGNSFIRALR
jgi:DNA processing protein